MWDEISQMTDLCYKCTKTELSNLNKNEIVLPPKHGAHHPPTLHAHQYRRRDCRLLELYTYNNAMHRLDYVYLLLKKWNISINKPF